MVRFHPVVFGSQALELGWSEHCPVTAEVAGSNPVGVVHYENVEDQPEVEWTRRPPAKREIGGSIPPGLASGRLAIAGAFIIQTRRSSRAELRTHNPGDVGSIPTAAIAP